MAQWRALKQKYPGTILLYRLGDFYETFYDDAVTASRALGITLTARNNGGAAEVPLAGVPAKALNAYLRRLVQQGFRVAICEQVEDPKLAKGVVRREVVEVVTPGAAFADDLLDGARNNYLCAVNAVGTTLGIAAADLSTGELRLAVSPVQDAEAVVARLAPSEVLIGKGQSLPFPVPARGDGNALVTERDAWEFEPAMAAEELCRQFAIASLDGFGIGNGDAAAVGAAGALIRYLRELQPAGVPHLSRPHVERPGTLMPLDDMTRRNLELVESMRSGDGASTLLSVLDRTQTPMGARLLRQWLLAPLVDRPAIERRLDAVAALAADALARASLREALDGVRDIERLAGKAAAGRAGPRDLCALGVSLSRLPRVEECARMVPPHGALAAILDAWDSCPEVAGELSRTLVERPPLVVGDEPTVRLGYDAELDELRQLRDGGKDAIARIEEGERARTGIGSLKVGYNKVFGYFIQVSNANRHLVPDDYQRRQTLTDAERYVTPALKEYEERVLTAAERIEAREREIVERLRAGVAAQVARVQRAAGLAAELDVLATLAEVAEREGYARPAVTEGFELDIVGGRHPVVERMMPRDKFIPNDVTLVDDARVVILTGPNMAGKSTILRQIGLIVLMAQAGSFVPATRATVGIVDRLFTRVGASDNLVRGQSTFMVEMAETSAILHTATRRSLVLLDEIGRGTSTYDGVSIAWSVSEHLHDRVGCKTVFATHYHELVQLAATLPAVRNYNVMVREVTDPHTGTPQVLFTHKLAEGGASRSYGIEVGRLAGLPATVLARAREVLAELEGKTARDDGRATKDDSRRARDDGRHPRRVPLASHDQLGLFAAPTPPHPVVEELKAVDANNLTPMQALALVARLAEQARGGAS